MKEPTWMNPEFSDLHGLIRTVPVKLISAQVSRHSAPWFFRGAEGTASFYIVLAGKCRLKFHEGGAGISLKACDLAVLLRGDGHWLQSCRNESRTDSGNETRILRGRFVWDQKRFLSLLPHLSPVVLFKADDECLVSWMKEEIRKLMDAADAGRPGLRAGIDNIPRTILARAILSDTV